MQLLAREEYGLRCLLQVAGAAGAAPVSISQISAAEGLSPEYTAKLMRELRLGDARDAAGPLAWTARRLLRDAQQASQPDFLSRQ